MTSLVLIADRHKLDFKLIDFLPQLPKEFSSLEKTIKTFPLDFITLWAIDFEYSDALPFKYHWQSFRTVEKPFIEDRSNIGWTYKTPGRYLIGIKVLDVFGGDSIKTIDVLVKA